MLKILIGWDAETGPKYTMVEKKVYTREEMSVLGEEIEAWYFSQEPNTYIEKIPRHIKTICNFLKKGNAGAAWAIYCSEGDKNKPEEQKYLNTKMGCRQHGVIGCPGVYCNY
jgi:hypothetical protein